VALSAHSALTITFRDRILNVSLLLSEDELAPLFDGAAWAGTQLWDAAIQGVDYVSDKYSGTLVLLLRPSPFVLPGKIRLVFRILFCTG